jgi:hypothetical protein
LLSLDADLVDQPAALPVIRRGRLAEFASTPRRSR